MRKNVWLGFLALVALVAWTAVGVEAARYESLVVGEILLESAIKSADGTATLLSGGASGGAIDGENLTDDTVDDDALDFADITSADLTFDTITLTNSGTVTMDGTTCATTNINLLIAGGRLLRFSL